MERLDPYPLIWAAETMSPHQPSKTRLSPKHHNQWRGWVTHVRIDGNPGIRGTRSLLQQDVPRKTASLSALRWDSENDSNKGLAMV